jgi:hypothetical protein
MLVLSLLIVNKLPEYIRSWRLDDTAPKTDRELVPYANGYFKAKK